MIHVAGYGSKSDIVDVEKKIEEINNQLGYTAIIYEGCLSSLEFSYLLQKSHPWLAKSVNAYQKIRISKRGMAILSRVTMW